jgi:hypothetical protein
VGCGPGTWRGCGRLGRAADVEEIVRTYRLQGEETSLADLKAAAEGLGFRAEGWKLSWDELKALDHPAILYLQTAHFVAVFPSGAGDDTSRIRVHDPNDDSIWWTKDRLERIWPGVALVISPRWPDHDPPGPRIAFDERRRDLGQVISGPAVEATFPFKNAGRMPLVIAGCMAGSSSIEAIASPDTVRPDATGRVAVTLDTRGKRGAFQDTIRRSRTAPGGSGGASALRDRLQPGIRFPDVLSVPSCRAIRLRDCSWCVIRETDRDEPRPRSDLALQQTAGTITALRRASTGGRSLIPWDDPRTTPSSSWSMSPEGSGPALLDLRIRTSSSAPQAGSAFRGNANRVRAAEALIFTFAGGTSAAVLQRVS